MIPRLAFVLLAVATALPNPLRAQSPDLEALVDSVVGVALDAGHLAGTSVGVVRGGETLLLEGYGHADLEWGVPMPAEAIFEVGSVTKQFTAVAALLLHERGELDLDADLTRYLPDYDTGGRAVPVRRLFDHTSGIQGYTEMPSVMEELATRDLPRDTLVTLFEARPFQFEPGHGLIYNNSAYFLLGLIVEAVSGQSYADFLEEHVFPSAGMDDTSYCTNDEVWARRAHGYSAGSEGLRRAAYLDHTWPYAAGSLCSTVPDLLDWIAALHGGEVLSEEAYDWMITPGGLADGTPTRYAGGLVHYDGPGGRMIGHGGGINGFLSETRWYPEHDAAVVVLANTTGPFDPTGLADAIGDALFGTPDPPAASYGGDLAALVGEYTGPIRGDNEARIRIDLDDDGGLVATGMGPASSLSYRGDVEVPGAATDGAGPTFAAGTTRFVFTLEGGVPTRLDLDHVYGHYVLTAGALGPAPAVDVDPAVLAAHVGRYEVAEMSAVAEITLDEGDLWIQITGQPRLRLIADDDRTYHLEEVPATVTFEVVEGATVALVIEQGPAVFRGARVEGG